MGNQSAFDLIKIMKDAITQLSQHYRARLYKNYCVNCPSSLTFIWSIAKGILNEDQKKKVNFLDGATADPLLQFTHP